MLSAGFVKRVVKVKYTDREDPDWVDQMCLPFWSLFFHIWHKGPFHAFCILEQPANHCKFKGSVFLKTRHFLSKKG